MADVSMPRLSDTMQEGTIARWLKQPGEAVKRGEVIAQIETDKATMDLESFDTGVLQEILAPEGATVPIGEPVARIGPSAKTAASPAHAEAATPAAPASAPGQPQAAPASAPDQSQAAPASVPDQPPAAPANVPDQPDAHLTATPEPPAANTPATGSSAPRPNSNGAANGKVRASPLARRIAAERGLDLALLHGSGPEGRVIRVDVEQALQQAPPPARTAPPAQPAGPDDQRVPLSQMRRTIARRMHESTSTVPHFFLTAVVDATELARLQRELVEQLAEAPEPRKVSLNDLIIKATALALRRVPEMNVSFADDVLVVHQRVHIGVAIATDRGLIVPVVRDADGLSVSQISVQTRDLAARAREGKLQPREYTGGTFSVSNLGMFGVEQFSAVINPPEAGILAVGAMLREPAELNGEIVLRDRLRVTLSVDHRAADGAVGARWLQALKKLLEHPLQLLA